MKSLPRKTRARYSLAPSYNSRMPSARRPPIAGLRRLLLALFIVGLAVVAAVFALRRRGDKPPVDAGGAGPRPEGEITLIGEGFQYTLSEEGRPVFDIQGASVKVRRGTVVLLEDVALTLYDEQGTPYHVAARQASYDRESHEASLDGALRLIGPDGLVLTADGLTVGHQGQRVETRGPAELLYAGLYRATARRIVARLRLDQFALVGRPEVARLEGPEPPTLTAGSITYRREDGVVRAETRVRLRRGADFLTTDRLVAHLTPDARRVELIHARRSVDGRMRLGAAATAPPPAPAEEGDDADRAPAVALVIPYLFATAGIWYPHGGIAALAHAVRDLAAKHGARIETGAAVARLEVAGGRFVAAITSAGGRIAADACIAAIDAGITARWLGKSEATTPREPAYAARVAWWVVEGGPRLGSHHAFHFDAEHEHPLYVAVPTVTDSALAPERASVHYALVHGRPGAPADPAFAEDVRARLVRAVAWPTGRVLAHGVAGGAESCYGTAIGPGLFASFRPSQRVPGVANLVRAGGSVFPGPGVANVIRSGLRAAALITDGARA